jgi:hypothetical protein
LNVRPLVLSGLKCVTVENADSITLKTVYLYGIAQRGPEAVPAKPVKNDFQNIEIAQRSATGYVRTK